MWRVCMVSRGRWECEEGAWPSSPVPVLVLVLVHAAAVLAGESSAEVVPGWGRGV